MKKLLVQHRSKIVKDKAFLEKTKKKEVRFIKAFYDGGEVCDHCGEVWKVKQHNTNMAGYETVGTSD